MLEVPQMQAQVDGVAVPDADVSLRIGSIILRPGDRLTITGPSGSGKTSMIECLAGWRTQCVTPLAIGGVPCDPASADVRRRLFALSSQDAPVIAGTIADNLRLARPGLQDRDLWAALETACLADDEIGRAHV